jgi:hypothetical protein
MAQPILTREQLQLMLDGAEGTEKLQHIIGRACVVLFERQTQHEQAANQTEMHNMVGFTHADALGGSLTAKTYLKNRSLQDWQVAKWTKRGKSGFSRLTKYWKQLNQAAEEKAKRAAAQGVQA